jgi:hypothetical protein
MTIHIQATDPSVLSKCGNFDGADDFIAISEDESNCIECRFFDQAQVAWEKYVAQPINFGGETDVFAEHDAFFAGYFAAIKEVVPF